MVADEREKALMEAFFGVLRGGETEALGVLVAEDCSDGDPLPFQLPGRAGVAQKVRLFRAAHPDARIVVESIETIERAGAGATTTTGESTTLVDGGTSRVRATWTTTARGLGGAAGVATWRFTGVFEIEAGKIQASRLERGGAI